MEAAEAVEAAVAAVAEREALVVTVAELVGSGWGVRAEGVAAAVEALAEMAVAAAVTAEEVSVVSVAAAMETVEKEAVEVATKGEVAEVQVVVEKMGSAGEVAGGEVSEATDVVVVVKGQAEGAEETGALVRLCQQRR